MDEHLIAGCVIDALAEKGYISDHYATTPMMFEAMVEVAAEAIRNHQRQIDLDTPD